MRLRSLFIMAGFVVLLQGAGPVVPAVQAQDVFLKKGGSDASGDDSGSKKLYLSPGASGGNATRFIPNQGRTLYNSKAPSSTSSTSRQSSGPSTQIDRGSELDEIQRLNIANAQAHAERNAKVIAEKQRLWEQERAARDMAYEKQKMAEQALAEQQSEGGSGANTMRNASYPGADNGMGLKKPSRTFNVYE